MNERTNQRQQEVQPLTNHRASFLHQFAQSANVFIPCTASDHTKREFQHLPAYKRPQLSLAIQHPETHKSSAKWDLITPCVQCIWIIFLLCARYQSGCSFPTKEAESKTRRKLGITYWFHLNRSGHVEDATSFIWTECRKVCAVCLTGCHVDQNTLARPQVGHFKQHHVGCQVVDGQGRTFLKGHLLRHGEGQVSRHDEHFLPHTAAAHGDHTISDLKRKRGVPAFVYLFISIETFNPRFPGC